VIDRLIPLEHPIPPGFRDERFLLRLITIHDAVRDYEAVMSSAHRLRRLFPEWGGWPEPGLTIEQDMIDLAWHQKEAQMRRSFNYAVMSPDESRLLGCVYVDPPGDAGADADVGLWVRDDEEGTGLEELLIDRVRQWLAVEWPFARVRWPWNAVA
jgi:RimJ/RimL family protein N-acetyltransferase